MREIRLEIDKEDFKKKLDIKDGKTPTKKELVEIIKPLIPEPKKEIIIEKPIITNETKEIAIHETPIEIKTKLETLEGEERLSVSAIKGLDDYTKKNDLNNAISILDNRTNFLINRVQQATSWGSIIGDINNQTDLANKLKELECMSIAYSIAL